MSTQAAAGAAALAIKDYPTAITSYTAALAQSPSSPEYYIQRSTAYQRLSPARYDLALQDAEAAVHFAHKRGKREAIATAQMRRGIALFGLRRWVDAGQCLQWAQKKNEKEAGLSIWQKKVEVEVEREKADEVGEVTVLEVPEVDTAEDGNRQTEVLTKGKEEAGTKPTVEVKKVAEGVQTPADKIRHEWYQTAENVVVTLLVKGVPKEKTTLEILERSVSISFPLPTSSTYDFSLDPLFAPIDTSTSTSSIMSTKIELVLKKSVPGQKWSSLESSSPTAPSSTNQPSSSPSTIKHPTPAPTSTSASAPTYPTSSRTGPKNWDKLADDLTKKPSKTTTDGKTTEADLDDDEANDPVDGFFKKLYAGADPDTRRAMMKSYQESNGTALSTNWVEVGKGKVETSPPEGMVAKSWDT